MISKIFISVLLCQVLSNIAVEGTPAISTNNIYAAPYHVAVFFNNSICAGSIIADNIILTAAHCTAAKDDNAYIRAGSSYFDRDGEVVGVKNVFNHPNYIFSTERKEFDISILELKTPLVLNDKNLVAVPIATYPRKSNSIGSSAGWAITATHSTGVASPDLRIEGFPFLTAKDCIEASKYKESEITDDMICAGYIENISPNFCVFDSGSGLIHYAELVGVMSWDKTCGLNGFPNIYADVYHYKDWINGIVDEINGKKTKLTT